MQTHFFEYVYNSAWCILSQSPLHSYSSSLPPKKGNDPPFSRSLFSAAKRQVHKPSWNLKFLPTSFPLSALSASVWPPLSYTQTWLSLWASDRVWAQKEHGNGRKQSKKEAEMWLGDLITAATPSVLVSEISQLGGTQWKVHMVAECSYFESYHSLIHELRARFTAKLNKGETI